MDGQFDRSREGRLKQARRRWYRTLILIAVAILLIALFIAEVTANHAPAADFPIPWTAHLQKMDDALIKDNVSAAVRAWREAHAAALGSQRWKSMVEVGDAYLRIGEAVEFRRAFVPKAREIYMAALSRARQQGALDGVLRTAEAFVALGDREVVEQCVRIAEDLAARARDAQARARVNAVAQRLASRFAGP